MSACDPQKSETANDNVSTNSIDEGLPREFSQISLTSTSSQDEFYNNGHSEVALKNIYGYYRSQKLCDVVLIAEGCRWVPLIFLCLVQSIIPLFVHKEKQTYMHSYRN